MKGIDTGVAESLLEVGTIATEKLSQLLKISIGAPDPS